MHQRFFTQVFYLAALPQLKQLFINWKLFFRISRPCCPILDWILCSVDVCGKTPQKVSKWNCISLTPVLCLFVLLWDYSADIYPGNLKAQLRAWILPPLVLSPIEALLHPKWAHIPLFCMYFGLVSFSPSFSSVGHGTALCSIVPVSPGWEMGAGVPLTGGWINEAVHHSTWKLTSIGSMTRWDFGGQRQRAGDYSSQNCFFIF